MPNELWSIWTYFEMYLFPGIYQNEIPSLKQQEPFGSLTLPAPQWVTQVQRGARRRCTRFCDVTSTSCNSTPTRDFPAQQVAKQLKVSMVTTDSSLASSMTQLKLNNGPTPEDCCDADLLQNEVIPVQAPVKRETSNDIYSDAIYQQNAHPLGAPPLPPADAEAKATTGSQVELYHELYQRQWHPANFSKQLVQLFLLLILN